MKIVQKKFIFENNLRGVLVLRQTKYKQAATTISGLLPFFKKKISFIFF